MSNIDQILKEAAKKKVKPIRRFDWQVERLYGQEPKWDDISNFDENFNQLVAKALSWVNASFEHSDFKAEVIKYAEIKGIPISKLEQLADYKFVNAGKVAWLLNNGCPLTENWIIRFKENLEKLLVETGTNDENGVQITDDGEIIILEEKPKLFERRNRTINKKVTEHLLDIEELVDKSLINKEEIDSSIVYKSFQFKKVDEKIAKQVFEKLNEKSKVLIKELNSLELLDENVILNQFGDLETYEKYLNDIQENSNQLINALNQIGSYLGNKKAIKKSEKKFGNKFKAKRIEAQVSNVNFKLQDNNYQIASINPVSIIGSMTLVVFNTKNRKLSVYNALSEEGLSLKGTTVQNFNEETSFQKIIKKPNMLKQFQEGNIRRLEVLLNDIKAKPSKVNGRINEHSILLKTFKEVYAKK